MDILVYFRETWRCLSQCFRGDFKGHPKLASPDCHES
jgi:hypothetical protein